MPVPEKLRVEAWHVMQFANNVNLLLQQRKPRLAGTTGKGSYHSEKAQVMDLLGEVEMNPFLKGSGAGQWYGDTVWSEAEHHQRWILPSAFNLALPLSKQDQLRMLVDPKSSYAEAMRGAYARKVDDIIIGAALGDSIIGIHGTETMPFPATQTVAAGGAGLTIDKLLEAKKMLIAAGNEPEEERFFACSEEQLNELLKTTEVSSADFNTVRALAKGELDTYMGFKFISTERLPVDTGTRQCLAWVKSGLHFGTWADLSVRADERVDKNNVWQIYAEATIGATRTEEKKVVRVDCLES